MTGRFVSTLGRTSHVVSRGQGQPVLLLHGNGSLGEEILSAFPEVKGIAWIAPDRPGFGQSDPLPEGAQDPLSQAVWLEGLMAALGVDKATVVAHSLATAAALALATARPARVSRLVLLSPFCRPTPERAMLGLRLCGMPVVGRVLRRLVVPTVVRTVRKRIIRGFMAPNLPPPWLSDFPVTHAANARAVKATVKELESFNAAMTAAEDQLSPPQPVTVVHGLNDKTAEPEWHLPWLRQRAPQMKCILLRGCGHAIHHASPGLVLRVILSDDIDDPRRDGSGRNAPGLRRTDTRAMKRPGILPVGRWDQHTGYTVV